MTDLVVRGGAVLTPGGRVAADLVLRAGRISSVARRTSSGSGARAGSASGAWSGSGLGSGPGAGASAGAGVPRTLDATGLLVVPGFVDLQCNGAGGFDLTADPERLWDVAALLPRWGVTAWLPTIVTAPAEVRARALAALAAGPPEGWTGAIPLGLHFEGPFLAPERRGAHNPVHLRSPDPALIGGWSRDAGVAMATMAPELPGALDLVAALTEAGVAVSLGHSDATEAEALAAVDAGARSVTHMFNAMPPARHRAPGLAGVALTDERLTVGLIVDGLHVASRMIDLAARALGDRLALVTDAVAALGLPPGPVRLGDMDAEADGRSVRLASGGPLAGSVLSLDQAVGNLAAFTAGRVDLDAAVTAATATPARLLGLVAERGVLIPGAAGDVVLLDPGPRSVVAAIVGGEVVYDRQAGVAERGPG